MKIQVHIRYIVLATVLKSAHFLVIWVVKYIGFSRFHICPLFAIKKIVIIFNHRLVTVSSMMSKEIYNN